MGIVRLAVVAAAGFAAGWLASGQSMRNEIVDWMKECEYCALGFDRINHCINSQHAYGAGILSANTFASAQP